MAASLGLTAAGLIYVSGGLPDFAGAWNNQQRMAELMIEIVQDYLGAFAQPRMWPVLGALQAAGMLVILLFYLATYGVNARAAQVALEEGALKPAA
jgi:hypothetical protein